MASQLHLGGDEHGAPGASDGPRLAAPNPFAAQDTSGNEPMPTASPTDSAAPAKGRAAQVTAAPVLPQPSRRNGGDARAMPVGACIEGRTKRMIARYEFGIAPERVSEEQCIAYFLQAKTPTKIDYASVDIAMRELEMKTEWPESESHMMNLQAGLEAILDRFNVVDVVFEWEQKRLVKQLRDALVPRVFRRAVSARLSLQ
ncbi:hypothetical protein PI124_g17273 [Phytophthora idaei]|nr:hypothetical protein PI125_g1011 [Phytophthora idaei]KAG3139203.1 hypothetical protein PI126_g16557 [Phytophthora idaei]KAG3237753.1 hypothetical protein PI124_g17273 [Phytophthora idaei]